MDELRPFTTDHEHLGTAIEAEEEQARTRWPRGQLPVDVADVRPADDPDVEPVRAQCLDEIPDTCRIGEPVGHSRSVPVEYGSLEPAGERSTRSEPVHG